MIYQVILILFASWDTLLETVTVYQITFLENVLSVTNILSLLLQPDRKDFTAMSCSVNTVLSTSEVIGEKSFEKFQ